MLLSVSSRIEFFHYQHEENHIFLVIKYNVLENLRKATIRILILVGKMLRVMNDDNKSNHVARI